MSDQAVRRHGLMSRDCRERGNGVFPRRLGMCLGRRRAEVRDVSRKVGIPLASNAIIRLYFAASGQSTCISNSARWPRWHHAPPIGNVRDMHLTKNGALATARIPRNLVRAARIDFRGQRARRGVKWLKLPR